MNRFLPLKNQLILHTSQPRLKTKLIKVKKNQMNLSQYYSLMSI